jgi:uncharacterized protein YcbK (DUF882 family)
MKLTPNFSLNEFACHDLDRTPVPDDLMSNVQRLAKNLQVLRDYLGKPIRVTSGFRTQEHQEKVGKAKASYHCRAMAADLKVAGLTPVQLHATIERLIADGKMEQGGLGLYPTFVHYDCRGTRARW